MKLTMWPRSKRGYAHVIVDKKIADSSVTLRPEGIVEISVSVGPIKTSGNFRGIIEISLSELIALVGIAEEKKLKLLMEHKAFVEETKKAQKKAGA